MKKLLSLARTDIFMSIMPIIGWYIFGFVYNDMELSNIFSLTYGYQFAFVLIYTLIIKGSLKYLKKNDEKDMSMAYSAILFAFLFMGIVTLIVFFNIKTILLYFRVSSKYEPFYILSLLFLSLEVVVCGISSVKQYEEKDKEAFRITIIYHIYKILIVIVSGLTIGKDDVLLSTIFIGILTTCYVAILFCKYAKIRKFYFNCFKGSKMELPNMIQAIFLFIIYFFGFQRVSITSAEVLLAYNLCRMCTDTQWDVLYSTIDTKTTLDVCDKRFESKKKSIILTNMLWGVILLASSALMIGGSYFIMNFDLKFAYTMLLIECSLYPIIAARYTLSAKLKLDGMGGVIGIISCFTYPIRLFLTFVIPSIYAINLALLFDELLTFIIIFVMYKVKRRKNLKAMKVLNGTT